MTVVKASCPMCGDVELDAAGFRLVVASHAARSYYAFTCPSCCDRVCKPAGEDIVRLLLLGGIAPEQLEIPAEALEEHHGGPLTVDDVLDVILELRARP